MEYKKVIVSLGKNVALARKRAGISQEELAFRIGKSKNTISNIERGCVPPKLETVIEIAEVLHADMTELFQQEKPLPASAKKRKTIKSIVNLLEGFDSPLLAHLYKHLEFLTERFYPRP